jgi:hypothetical protein
MKFEFYACTKLGSFFSLLMGLGLSQTSMAQCSADAGEDIGVCQLGAINLDGSFVTSPSTPVLDINQSVINTCMANFAQTGLAQSFTATSATICGAGISFQEAANGMLVINLWTSLPNAGGTMIATGSAMIENSTIGNVYWNSVPLTIGSVYYLELTTTSPAITACVSGTTVDAYAGGNVFANGGFSAFFTYDYAFRTFTCAPAANLTWTGPNITSGANTATPTINPPVGVHTYTLTVVDPSNNCTATDQVTVTVGLPVSNQVFVNATDSYSWNGVVYTVGGQYTQVLQSSLGCDSVVALVLNMSYTGIDDFETNSVSIYPNPTDDFVIVEFEATMATIELIDAQGKIIRNAEILSGEQIAMHDLDSGVYLLRITTDRHTTVHRVVRQ